MFDAREPSPRPLTPAQDRDVTAVLALARDRSELTDLPRPDRLSRLGTDPEVGPRLSRLRASGLHNTAIASALSVRSGAA